MSSSTAHSKQQEASSSSSSSGPRDDISLTLTLRYRRPCSKTEVLAVGVSPLLSSAAAVYAIHADERTPQTWIEVFDLATRRGISKTSGSHAAFAPPLPPAPAERGPLSRSLLSSTRTSDRSSGGEPNGTLCRMAAVRDWTVEIGGSGGVELPHASSVLIRDAAGAGKTLCDIREASRGAPLAWSADGRFLAAAEGAHRMGVWEVSAGSVSGTKRRLGRVVSHIDAVTHAAFLPDRNLVTLSRDGTLRISNPFTARTLRRLDVASASAATGVPGTPRLLSVSPDGRAIVCVWGTTLLHWLSSAFTPSSSSFSSSSSYESDSHLTSYDLSTVRAAEGWPLCASPDGRFIAFRTETGFDVMSVASGTVEVTVRDEDEDGPLRAGAAAGAMVTAGAFSTDGKVLVLGRMDGTVDIWDVQGRDV